MDERIDKCEMEMIELKENKIVDNGTSLEKEFQWFALALDARFKDYFVDSDEYLNLPTPPNLGCDDSNYAQLIREYDFGIVERLVLCLALAPHFKSHILDLFFTTNTQLNRPFTEFGGYAGKDHNGFLPTGETVAFLVSQESINKRIELWELFSPRHAFSTGNILYLHRTDPKEPFLSGRLMINEEFLGRLTSGDNYLPESTDMFPAKRILTKMSWDDLVVNSRVLEELLEIKTWIENSDSLMEDPVFSRHIKPGFRSLFYGPPGTGKTMAASLIGKTCGLDVYRIDLSLIVSKYIGETEKNLAKVFKYAEQQNWILFFDEADALFGKRTQTNSSNDRFANQEVAYLLQRIEDFPGIIILASNLKSNMDEAFSRRFQSTIYFPIPERDQRLLLWKNIFNGQIKLAPSIDLYKLADEFELAGGAMINVLRSSTLKTIKKNKKEIDYSDIIDSIRKEYQKIGKTI